MPATSLKPIPAPVLYPLLKALNPPKAIKGRFKAPKGMKVNAAAKRSLLATLTAAEEAKSPQQFASLLNGGTATSAAQVPQGWGAITELHEGRLHDHHRSLRERQYASHRHLSDDVRVGDGVRSRKRPHSSSKITYASGPFRETLPWPSGVPASPARALFREDRRL
jgi:hypothetical protein